MGSSKTLTGTGKVRTGEYPADYRVMFEYKEAPPQITKIEAEITGPVETIRALAGQTATLVLKEGQELDGFFNQDGRISPSNYNKGARGFLDRLD